MSHFKTPLNFLMWTGTTYVSLYALSHWTRLPQETLDWPSPTLSVAAYAQEAPRPDAVATSAVVTSDGGKKAAASARRAIPDSTQDAFSSISWVPPPPPPLPLPVQLQAPTPPPAPTAPPVPFALLGLIENGSDRPQAFLTRGDTLWIVAQGESIENTYRVESFAAQSIVLTYLPLDIQQTVALAGSSP